MSNRTLPNVQIEAFQFSRPELEALPNVPNIFFRLIFWVVAFGKHSVKPPEIIGLPNMAPHSCLGVESQGEKVCFYANILTLVKVDENVLLEYRIVKVKLILNKYGRFWVL